MKKILLKLHPVWEHDTVSCMDICIEITECGKRTFSYPSSGFSERIPFPVYENLMFRDDAGEISYEITERALEDGPLKYRQVRLKCETEGTLQYSYRIYPRILPANYRSCPYYDFRNEENGATGSGLFSLILPEDEESIYELETVWDLKDLPTECRALFSFEKMNRASIRDIRFAFFMVGKMQQISSASAKFYWLTDPDFDIREIGNRVTAIFDYIKKRFHDSDSTFLMFIRRDPFAYSGGGTAAPYVFISGYSTMGTTDINGWENVLIHEMTHTWPEMTDSVLGYPLTWFNEGMVEYYCAWMPYQGGFYSKEYMLELLKNKATKRYYNNTYRTYSEKEIEQIQWSDMEAQTVPYGKGFMYLSMIAYKLQKKNKSLDDIIIDKYGAKLREQDWLDFLQEEFGCEGVEEYKNMLQGKLIIPPKDLFEGFKCEPFEIEIGGTVCTSYDWVSA